MTLLISNMLLRFPAGCCRHVCPYHASRDVLNEGAALVFVTYSQLLDPPVRSANGLDDLLKGAVLVFDEVQQVSCSIVIDQLCVFGFVPRPCIATNKSKAASCYTTDI